AADAGRRADPGDAGRRAAGTAADPADRWRVRGGQFQPGDGPAGRAVPGRGVGGRGRSAGLRPGGRCRVRGRPDPRHRGARPRRAWARRRRGAGRGGLGGAGPHRASGGAPGGPVADQAAAARRDAGRLGRLAALRRPAEHRVLVLARGGARARPDHRPPGGGVGPTLRPTGRPGRALAARARPRGRPRAGGIRRIRFRLRRRARRGGGLMERVMVVWCPDWPIVAARTEEELAPDAPVAVISKGEVYACSAAAREEGVRIGLRRRDAVAPCPELVLLEHQPERDLRVFGSVLTAMEEVTPGVMPIAPGRCAVRVPSRYYGGEAEAAAVIAEHLVTAGVWDCRIGIADGVFAAEQAARLAEQQGFRAVPPGGSAEFLAPLPIRMLGDPELVGLLARLGIRTLGAFARLPRRDVVTRFGRSGGRLHRLAGGQDETLLASRTPPLEFTRACPFEPGLTSIETIGFSIRQTTDAFVGELARHGLVCTAVRI